MNRHLAALFATLCACSSPSTPGVTPFPGEATGDGSPSGDGAANDGTPADGTPADGAPADGDLSDGSADGAPGDGSSADGAPGDGSAADGAQGDGSADGAPGDGSSADGAQGDGSTADGTQGDGTPDGSDGDGGSEPTAPCNGHPALCARRFDEVVYPCTHNAHSAEEYGFSALNRNQTSGFTKQLADGVRCMLVDVYDKSGEHMFCHNPDLCFLGSLGHVEGLTILKDFLDSHPREVLTLIYENGMGGDLIADDMRSIGLDALAFTYDAQAGWPTLGEMIDANKRLVVTVESGEPATPWVRNVWSLTWDTPYTFFAASEFNCNLNRGQRGNPLFLVNHWLNTRIPIVNIEKPDEGKADEANAYDMLYGRARGCWNEANDLPNFVAVDFYEHGDLFQVVDALNGL